MTSPEVGAGPQLSDSYHLVVHERVGSVMDEARLLARAEARAGTVVWARRQDAGRGRRGRTWQSPTGNLYCAILLRPECAIAEAAQMSFVAALAVAETVEALLPGDRRVGCKWPNDVLVDGAKIAGILLESEAMVDSLRWLIVGIGINLASHPTDVEFPATSIAAGGGSASPEDTLVRLTDRFESWLARWRDGGFPPIREAWLGRAVGLGRAVRVRLSDRELGGIFEGLDDTGALVLLEQGGRRRTVTAGEVYWG